MRAKKAAEVLFRGAAMTGCWVLYLATRLAVGHMGCNTVRHPMLPRRSTMSEELRRRPAELAAPRPAFRTGILVDEVVGERWDVDLTHMTTFRTSPLLRLLS